MAEARWLAPLRSACMVIAALGLLLLGMAADARAGEPQRLALVLGNAKYRYAGILENATNDANDMTQALKGLKFDVTTIDNADLSNLDDALAAFTAKIAPGDTVVVFYAGHGVMGQASAQSQAMDNYIVPVDARFEAPTTVPNESLALQKVLAALERSRAGPRILILDACRNNPFSESWASQPAPAGAEAIGNGLVQPPSASLRNVYIAFATSPGKTADDNTDGKNGLFTQELLKRINAPGRTVGGLFEDVAGAVEVASKGEQTPWFAAGGAEAANVVLNPTPGSRTPVADLFALDLRLTREALECGLPVCLESAAADVRSSSLKAELADRAASLRAAVKSASPTGHTRAPAPPAFDSASYGPAVATFVRAHQGDLEGWADIADHFLMGREGFPKDEPAAMRWYRAAGLAGSGEAAYAVGSAYHRGAPGVPANAAEAYRWFRRAADAGYPQAFAMVGLYNLNGIGGQPANDFEAAKWFKAGRERGDAVSIRQLADLTFANKAGLVRGPEGGEVIYAEALYQEAADAGDPEAMLRVADFMLFTQGRPPPGIRGSLEQSAALVRKAADLGLLQAYGQTALNYQLGRGVPKDEVEALRWHMLGAERGSAGSMEAIGEAYENGAFGLTKDCHQAGRWFRRAQVAGAQIFKLYTAGGKCASYR